MEIKATLIFLVVGTYAVSATGSYLLLSDVPQTFLFDTTVMGSEMVHHPQVAL